jgi:YfiH family protein
VNADWLVPQWPAPAHVHAVCTTRAGGTSVAPYDSLNLGDHVGDRPLDVAANRAILQQAMGAQPVFLSQVHGAQVVWLSDKTVHGTQADGCITDQPRVACTIMVADCLPLLLTNQQGSRVAAVHAGWRGLAGQGGQGILEAVLERFRAPAPVDSVQDASKIIAWLGPCIGPEAFEVGDEVRDAFVVHDRAALALFKPQASGKWLADLQGLARLRLAALGVTQIYGNDGSRSWCTVSQPLRFFSHRRDRVSGRMAACIWLD